MKARILITLDVETNLDDDTIERRLEALIDPEEVAALLLEEGDELELLETTFHVERETTPSPDHAARREAAFQRTGYFDHMRTAFERGYDDAWAGIAAELARLRNEKAAAAQREAILEEMANPDAFLR